MTPEPKFWRTVKSSHPIRELKNSSENGLRCDKKTKVQLTVFENGVKYIEHDKTVFIDINLSSPTFKIRKLCMKNCDLDNVPDWLIGREENSNDIFYNVC